MRYAEKGLVGHKVHNNCPINLIGMALMEYTTAVIKTLSLK